VLLLLVGVVPLLLPLLLLLPLRPGAAAGLLLPLVLLFCLLLRPLCQSATGADSCSIASGGSWSQVAASASAGARLLESAAAAACAFACTARTCRAVKSVLLASVVLLWRMYYCMLHCWRVVVARAV
jgi:hypothetical protein